MPHNPPRILNQHPNRLNHIRRYEAVGIHHTHQTPYDMTFMSYTPLSTGIESLQYSCPAVADVLRRLWETRIPVPRNHTEHSQPRSQWGQLSMPQPRSDALPVLDEYDRAFEAYRSNWAVGNRNIRPMRLADAHSGPGVQAPETVTYIFDPPLEKASPASLTYIQCHIDIITGRRGRSIQEGMLHQRT